MEELFEAYRERFGEYPPMMIIPSDQAEDLIRTAIESGEPITMRSMGYPDDVVV